MVVRTFINVLERSCKTHQIIAAVQAEKEINHGISINIFAVQKIKKKLGLRLIRDTLSWMPKRHRLSTVGE